MTASDHLMGGDSSPRPSTVTGSLIDSDAATYPIDVAWREAEAALPEGVRIWGVFDNAGAADTGPWQAEAWGITDGGPDFIAYGPTPAAALRALAEKLREVKG